MNIDPEAAFRLGNMTALVGWGMLIVLPRRIRPLLWIPKFVIPALLALGYSALLLPNFAASGGGFGSIADVRTLFATDAVLVAGWLHYLAFDLFVGVWIAERSDEARIPRLIQAAFLIATFMFGPLGLLLFLAARAALPSLRSPGA
jgi:hypothetical protein